MALDLPTIRIHYPDNEILRKWAPCNMKKLYIIGFKYCDICNLMVKTDDLNCRICGKRLRYKIKFKGWKR
jgi:hypothetical protein